MSGAVMSASRCDGGVVGFCARQIALTQRESLKVSGLGLQQALDVHVLRAEIFDAELAAAWGRAVLPESDPMQQEAGRGGVAEGVGQRDQKCGGSLHRIVSGMEVILLDQIIFLKSAGPQRDLHGLAVLIE